jgi:hypothetical protein
MVHHQHHHHHHPPSAVVHSIHLPVLVMDPSLSHHFPIIHHHLIQLLLLISIHMQQMLWNIIQHLIMVLWMVHHHLMEIMQVAIHLIHQHMNHMPRMQLRLLLHVIIIQFLMFIINKQRNFILGILNIIKHRTIRLLIIQRV